MNQAEFINQVQGNLIVSCQALPDEPLYSETGGIMPKMAVAAELGGASAIRANSIRDIKEIQQATKLPIIGIIKKNYPPEEPYITPTMAEVEQLVAANVDVIALDCTSRQRHDGSNVTDFIEKVQERFPKQLLMADVSTYTEGVIAYQAGADFIGTTLSGYTIDSPEHDGPDFALVERLASKHIPVIAEGKIRTPQMANHALQVGAMSVVVGAAITRPAEITARFVNGLTGKPFYHHNF
ncbi:N-acetylmannosamine-6-phosphate 2-epimerase [Lactobacillus selangorensis]|uniref:Putative N-acetylmannosamine-6-phosphate 2-epimerase n=1 Tax=Lactobacillus selangorensis TaxID=81857 RepID=A0A0R2GAF2_9LACO|nr:N-acetylmannosamine-6-phosphate 2-epimerase [Lactobacillus selangorensis]KRN29723.1 N-acetylmannosamine-6-phosphate 2-epimerase [Lactobacillus selangorensis]KRN33748.1 N-acetylmannosamine-6-phosphate 2-epimerase [Lactobacillus selangorensis]